LLDSLFQDGCSLPLRALLGSSIESRFFPASTSPRQTLNGPRKPPLFLPGPPSSPPSPRLGFLKLRRIISSSSVEFLSLSNSGSLRLLSLKRSRRPFFFVVCFSHSVGPVQVCILVVSIPPPPFRPRSLLVPLPIFLCSQEAANRSSPPCVLPTLRRSPPDGRQHPFFPPSFYSSPPALRLEM